MYIFIFVCHYQSGLSAEHTAMTRWRQQFNTPNCVFSIVALCFVLGGTQAVFDGRQRGGSGAASILVFFFGQFSGSYSEFRFSACSELHTAFGQLVNGQACDLASKPTLQPVGSFIWHLRASLFFMRKPSFALQCFKEI